MNALVAKYIDEHGIKDNFNWSNEKAEEMRNDDSYQYIIDERTDGGIYLKKRRPMNDTEDLIQDILNTMKPY